MTPFVPWIVPGTNRVCPRDKPGEIGLPLCRIRRIPGFVPVFHRILSQGQTGFVPGTNPVKTGTNRTKKFMFMCLFLAQITRIVTTKPWTYTWTGYGHFPGRKWGNASPRKKFWDMCTFWPWGPGHPPPHPPWSAANGGLRDGGLSKSEDIWGKRPFSSVFSIFQVLFGPSGKGWKRQKKGDFGRFPGRDARRPSNPHLLHPHLRHSNPPLNWLDFAGALT